MNTKRKKKNIAIILSVITLLIIAFMVFHEKKEPEDAIPLCSVERGPLTISVINSGTIHSRDKEIITCELEGRSILTWMIPEGTNVQKGDLLVEFDADEIIEDFEQQEVRTVNAKTALEVAQEKVKVTEGDNAASLLESEVGVELAKMDLDKYKNGDYPQQVRQIEANIALANEEVQRASEKLEWSRKLAEEGYLTRTELQADELALQRKKIDLEMTQTKMNLLTNYTVRKETALLESDLRKADRKLERIKWQNMSAMRTAEAQLFARNREYTQATSRLEKIRFEIDKSKIYAPTNGFILYATTVKMRKRWWTRPLTIGSSVAKREELIYMPLEAGMVVEMMIPEASLNKIFDGMPAKIKIDAFPGRVFDGNLSKIAILPDAQSSQLNPGLKLYKCEVECNFKDIVVRPGMSCDVELITETHDDALYIPVQCVVRVDDQSRVYIQEDGEFVPRNIEVGLDNNTMVHILSGINEGDIVMLAPPVAEEKDDKSKNKNNEKRPEYVPENKDGNDKDTAAGNAGRNIAEAGGGDGKSAREKPADSPGKAQHKPAEQEPVGKRS